MFGNKKKPRFGAKPRFGNKRPGGGAGAPGQPAAKRPKFGGNPFGGGSSARLPPTSPWAKSALSSQAPSTGPRFGKGSAPSTPHNGGGSALGPQCKCTDFPPLKSVKRLVKKEGRNKGRSFWTCPKPRGEGCGFFEWADDSNHLAAKFKGGKFEKKFGSANKYGSAKKSMNNRQKPKFSGGVLIEFSLHSLKPKVELAIGFEYNQKLINVCRRFGRWDAEAYKWIVAMEDKKKVSEALRNCCSINGMAWKEESTPDKIMRTVRKWIKLAKNKPLPGDPLEALPDKLRTSLYDFQKEGVRFAVQKGGRVLIADEMGLGKSIQAIAVAAYYRDTWPALIVCPSSLKYTWREEILKWIGKGLPPHEVNCIRTGKDKIQKNKKVTIISYGLATRKSAEIQACNFGIVICDESHALKNSKSQRTKVMTGILKRAKHALLLSGTPMNNRPAELWTQIDSLRPSEFMGYRPFTTRYCDGHQGAFQWEAKGATNTGELHMLLKERVMIRRLKKNVLDQLPDKIRSMVVIDVTDRKLDKKMKEAGNIKDMIAESQREVNKMQGSLMEIFKASGIAKVKEMKDYMTSLAEADTKFLVFAHHKAVLDALEDHVKKKLKTGYIRIDGSTKDYMRQEHVNTFQTQPQVQIAILSITAAGTGLTLTAADTVVFAELYWSPSDLLQCEDRIHRIGQKNSCNIVYVLGKNTVDDVLWPMIQRKLNVSSKVLAGREQSLNVEKMSELRTDANGRDIRQFFKGGK